MRCRQARIDNNEDNEGRQVAALPPAVAREGDSHHSIASPARSNKARFSRLWMVLARPRLAHAARALAQRLSLALRPHPKLQYVPYITWDHTKPQYQVTYI